MPRRLPDHALAAMEHAVDALMAQCAAGDSAAFARIAAATDGGRSGGRGDAEQTIAFEHGFASWRQAMVHCALFSSGETAKEAPDFLRLACLNYFHTDRPENQQRARDLLAADAQLATRDIWHAACVGDVAAVEHLLAADPGLAQRMGGYFDWPPLLYACYSRLDLPGMSTLGVARLLLAHGAYPNAHYMWGGVYRFTALTGAFGEGEMGPVNQPPHQDWRALARLLLDAGADPNDSQALYNTMFTPGSACLEMLLQYGLAPHHKCNWLANDGDDLVPNDEQTLGYQLAWAVRNHHEERAKLLIDNGAETTAKPEGRTLYEWAWLTGHPQLARYLAEHGAETVELGPELRLAGLCMSGVEADGQAAQRMIDTTPDLVDRTQAMFPNLLADAAAGDRQEAVAGMLALGFDPGVPHRTPLHQAAFHGRKEMAKLLLDGGADLSARDDDFAATPLQWAITAGQAELADYLGERDIGIFDAALREDEARMGKLLKAKPALLAATIGDERKAKRPHAADWQTPLAFAALRGLDKAVAFLLAQGARADVSDGDGRPLIDHARAAGHAVVLSLLEDAAR